MLRFLNDGGPLLLSPSDPRPNWEGVNAPSGGRIVDSETRTVLDVATDYDLACDVDDGARLLPAGDGWVIVLTPSAEGYWLPEPPPGVAAVAIGIEAWVSEATRESLRALYLRFASEPWTVLGDSIALGSGGIALMHAGGRRGSEAEYAHDAEHQGESDEIGSVCIGDALVFPVPPGRYRIEAYEYLVRRSATIPGEYLALVRFLATDG